MPNPDEEDSNNPTEGDGEVHDEHADYDDGFGKAFGLWLKAVVTAIGLLIMGSLSVGLCLLSGLLLVAPPQGNEVLAGIRVFLSSLGLLL